MMLDIEKIRQREVDRINEEVKQKALEEYSALLIRAIKNGVTTNPPFNYTEKIIK